MDKQLLKALDNLSNALEMIADALEKKGGSGTAAPTTTALQGGDFGKSLKEINAGIKSIKLDTKQILKSQQTILSMQKKKDADKKTGIIEESGGSKESENKMKKGIGIILLIAIAVLAIGMAFKLVGKIDFLSVIGLSLAILVMAVAFEKVAKLKITLKEAAVTSGALVLIALAITISSWIMSLIVPISLTQFLTATFIAITFAAMSKYLTNIFIATAVFDKMKVSKTALLLTLVSISAAITASSWIMQFIRPIGFAQGMTAVLIALVFSLIGYNLHKIGTAVAMFKKIPGLKPMDLVWVLLAVSSAITASSWILQLIMPVGWMKLLTGILIATMFLVISFNLEKIAVGVVAFKKTGVKAKDLLLVMVGIAAAITASSWVMQLIMPIGLWQFVTALGITILFAIMSYIMPELAGGIALVGKLLGVNKVFLIPLVMVAISLAIMLSSLLLQFTAPIGFIDLIRILVFSVVLAIAVIVVGLAAFILAVVFGLKNIEKGAVAIVILAAAIAAASNLLAIGNYSIYPPWLWTLEAGLSIIAFGLIAFIFNKLGGPKDYIKGGLVIVIIATTIMISSHILGIGNYSKYPTAKWILGVGLSIVTFGLAALVLGLIAMADGGTSLLLGSLMVLVVSAAIMISSHILAAGNYKKFPGLMWVLGVAGALTTFGVGAIILGTQAINPFFYAGLGMIALVAATIVEVAKILSKGKYNLPGLVGWAASVALLFATFTPLIIVLGMVGAAAAVIEFFGGDNPFEAGREMLKSIAETIVDVADILAKGNFKGGPTVQWAKAVAIGIGAFAPVYDMMMRSAIFKAIGLSGVGPSEFNDGIRTVTGGIVFAAQEFAKNKVAFKNGPPVAWARGVGMAIGAFAPVYEAMNRSAIFKIFGGEGVGPEDMKTAIMTISQGIVDAAIFFSENTAPFEEGKYPSAKWGKGVGAALSAFAPVFKQMHEDSGWFTSGEEVVDSMKYAIVVIAGAIVSAASVLSTVTPEMWQSFPSDKWGSGIKSSVLTFIDLFDTMEQRNYSTVFFTIQTKILSMAVSSMASIARMIHFNQKYFNATIPKTFIDGLSKNVLGFGKLAKDLDKLLIVEKMVTKEKFNVFGGLAQKETKMQRERRDLSLVKDVVVQMAAVARILFSNKKYFQNTSFLTKWTKDVVLREGAVMKFTLLNLQLNKYKKMFGKETMAERVAKSMVRTSLILYKAKDAFAMEVDPNFMKNVGQNMIDFNEIVKKLAESEGEGKGFLGKIGDAAEGLLGTDPISQIAQRMVTLAKGYDAMASALIKLSFAMKLLKVDSMAKLGGITRAMLGKKPVEDEEGEKPGLMSGMMSRFSEVGRKKEDSPSVKSGGGARAQKMNKDSIFYVSERLEELIKIMSNIERQTSTIDESMEILTDGKIKPPPEKSDFG